MASREEILRLSSELTQEMDLLPDLVSQNERALDRIAAGSTDNLDYAALGYTIHNLYSLTENYALRIAKTFENQMDDDARHRDLVRRMTLDIPTIRPAVWGRDLARHIDELRRFRHAFRHIYDTKLDPDKLMLAQKHVLPAVSGLREAHELFVERLAVLAANVT